MRASENDAPPDFAAPIAVRRSSRDTAASSSATGAPAPAANAARCANSSARSTTGRAATAPAASAPVLRKSRLLVMREEEGRGTREERQETTPRYGAALWRGRGGPVRD